MSTDIKRSKAQWSKIIQPSDLLDKLAYPWIKVGVPLAKNFLTPLAAIASVSAINDAIRKKCVEKEQ